MLKNNEENNISPDVKHILKQNDVDWHDMQSVMQTAAIGELSKQLIINVGWEKEYIEYKKEFINKISNQILKKHKND